MVSGESVGHKPGSGGETGVGAAGSDAPVGLHGPFKAQAGLIWHGYGYLCIPVVIAESWGGDLSSLKCEHLVYIQANPNQSDQIALRLASEFEQLLPVWKEFAEEQ